MRETSLWDRLLPPHARAHRELRPRARALVRTALWSWAWSFTAGLLTYEAAHPGLAGIAMLLGLAALASLVRLRRRGDLPSAASALGLQILATSAVVAWASGGLASPALFAVTASSAVTAAFGRAGMFATLMLPVVLWLGADLHSPPLEGLEAAGLAFATLAFITGVAAELLVSERTARAVVKADALRARVPETEAERWERLSARVLLEHAPVGLMSLDRDGRLGRLRSAGVRSMVQVGGPEPQGDLGELLAWVGRAGDESALRGARDALALWRQGANAETVFTHLPRRLRHPVRGEVELSYGLEMDDDGVPSRFVVAVTPRHDAPSKGAGGRLLELFEAQAEGKPHVSVQVDHDADLPVPEPVRPVILAAIDALVENAMLAMAEPAARTAAGKPSLPCVELRAFRRGRTLVIAVADDGEGIPWAAVATCAARRGWPTGSREELLQAILQPGLSTEGGAGEGLARVRAAAEGLGGKLTLAASVEREGTVFEMVLPLPIPASLRIRPSTGPSSGRRSDLGRH